MEKIRNKKDLVQLNEWLKNQWFWSYDCIDIYRAIQNKIWSIIDRNNIFDVSYIDKDLPQLENKDFDVYEKEIIDFFSKFTKQDKIKELVEKITITNDNMRYNDKKQIHFYKNKLCLSLWSRGWGIIELLKLLCFDCNIPNSRDYDFDKKNTQGYIKNISNEFTRKIFKNWNMVIKWDVKIFNDLFMNSYKMKNEKSQNDKYEIFLDGNLRNQNETM